MQDSQLWPIPYHRHSIPRIPNAYVPPRYVLLSTLSSATESDQEVDGSSRIELLNNSASMKTWRGRIVVGRLGRYSDRRVLRVYNILFHRRCISSHEFTNVRQPVAVIVRYRLLCFECSYSTTTAPWSKVSRYCLSCCYDMCKMTSFWFHATVWKWLPICLLASNCQCLGRRGSSSERIWRFGYVILTILQPCIGIFRSFSGASKVQIAQRQVDGRLL